MGKVDKKKEVKVLPILKLWLIVYNFMSCYGWGSVLYQLTDHLITSEGEYQGSYQLISQLLVVVQTCALLEVVHASVGLVKSSAFTTMVQVSSRLFIVWLILDQFPQKSVRESMFFSSMVVAWSVTEIIRYTFYALTLLIGTAPYISLWTRYTFFFVLYPLGAGSEWMLVQEAKKVTTNPILYWCLLAMQLIYVPGFAFMYTHMIKQRKKCLGAPDSDKKRK